MEEKVDQLDCDTSYFLDIEELLQWLNKVKTEGAVKVLFDGNVNHMKDEIDTVSIKAYKQPNDLITGI